MCEGGTKKWENATITCRVDEKKISRSFCQVVTKDKAAFQVDVAFITAQGFPTAMVAGIRIKKMTVLDMKYHIKKNFPGTSSDMPDFDAATATAALGLHSMLIDNIGSRGTPEEQAALGAAFGTVTEFKAKLLAFMMPEFRIRFVKHDKTLVVIFVIKKFMFMEFLDRAFGIFPKKCKKRDKDGNVDKKAKGACWADELKLLNLELGFIVMKKDGVSSVCIHFGIDGFTNGRLPNFPGKFAVLSKLLNIPLTILGGQVKRMGLQYASPNFIMDGAMGDMNGGPGMDDLVPGDMFPTNIDTIEPGAFIVTENDMSQTRKGLTGLVVGITEKLAGDPSDP